MTAPSKSDESDATPEAERPWFVYVLVSASGNATYVGATNDLERRVEQHNGQRPGGARSTRAGRPWHLGASLGPFADRGLAQRVEHAVKQRRGRARLEVSTSAVLNEL